MGNDLSINQFPAEEIRVMLVALKYPFAKDLVKKKEYCNRGWRTREIEVNPADGYLYILVDNSDAPFVVIKPAGE